MAFLITHETATDKLPPQAIARGMQSGVFAGLSVWAQDRQGLGGRLASDSWTLYGWTRRSPGYEKRQARGQWGVLPFVSPPTRKSYGGIGKFLFSLTRPGQGHNVYSGPVSETQAEATLTVPAARGLNFARNGGVYLAEWGKVYPADEAGIEARIVPAADRAIQEELNRG